MPSVAALKPPQQNPGFDSRLWTERRSFDLTRQPHERLVRHGAEGMSHPTYSQRISAPSVRGMSRAIVLVLNTKVRLFVFNIRPAGISARFLCGRPAVSPFLGICATAAKLTEFARKWGAGSIDSLVRS